MKHSPTRFLRLFYDAAKGFVEHRGLQSAATISYFATLSIIPFFVLLVSATGFLIEHLGARHGSEAEMLDLLKRAISDVIPYYSSQIIARIEEILHARQTIGILGIVFLSLTSALVFDAVRSALKEIFSGKKKGHFILSRLLFFLFVFALGSILFGTYLLFVLVKPILQGMGLPSLTQLLEHYRVLDFLVSFVLIAGGYCVVVSYFAQRRIPFIALVSGGILFFVLFSSARVAFAYYVSHIAKLDLVYGSLATLMVGIIWIYYSAVIFLYSAEFTSQLERSWLRSKR